MTRQLDCLPADGEILPPLKTLEQHAQECHALIKEISTLGSRINRLNNRARKLNGKIDDCCLLLGFELLAMRKQAEAESQPWWECFAHFFPDISRSHAERWLRIAASQEPESAALEYRQKNAAYQREFRGRQKQLALPSYGKTEAEPELTVPRINSFRRNLPKPVIAETVETEDQDAAADLEITRIFDAFFKLEERQQDRCLRRIMARYKR
jgi:hypothetical protein